MLNGAINSEENLLFLLGEVNDIFVNTYEFPIRIVEPSAGAVSALRTIISLSKVDKIYFTNKSNKKKAVKLLKEFIRRRYHNVFNSEEMAQAKDIVKKLKKMEVCDKGSALKCDKTEGPSSSPVSLPIRVPLAVHQELVNSYGTGDIGKIAFGKSISENLTDTVKWTAQEIDEGIFTALILATKGYMAQAPPQGLQNLDIIITLDPQKLEVHGIIYALTIDIPAATFNIHPWLV